MDERKVEIGRRIKECRNEIGYSQERLAEELDAKRTNITNYEAGRISPTLKTIVAMAEIFEVSTDYLLIKSDNKNQGEPLDSGIDDESRAIARGFQDLNPERKRLFKDLLNDMSEKGKEEKDD